MKREDFLAHIGHPANLIAEADRFDAEAQTLWDTIRDAYFTKGGKERKKQPARWENGEAHAKFTSLGEQSRILRRKVAHLQRLHKDPWSHIRAESLREFGLEAEALVVDAARERMALHNNNARFIAEAENVGDLTISPGEDR